MMKQYAVALLCGQGQPASVEERVEKRRRALKDGLEEQQQETIAGYYPNIPLARLGNTLLQLGLSLDWAGAARSTLQ